MAAPYVCMTPLLLTTGVPPDVFITQLLPTTVRHVDTAEAFTWQTSAGLPIMHI